MILQKTGLRFEYFVVEKKARLFKQTGYRRSRALIISHVRN